MRRRKREAKGSAAVAPGAVAARADAAKQRLEEFFARAKQRQVANTAAAIAGGGAPATVAEAVAEDAFTLTRKLVAESPARADIQCGRGCSWCCHQQVRISPPEAIAIANVLRETYPPEWIAALRRVVAQRVEVIDRLRSPGEYLAARLPCAFLNRDGECAIYEWRPIVCRGYHSLSRSACQEKYVDMASPAPPIDSFGLIAANAVLHGVRQGCARSGSDGRLYELHSILLRALDAPDAGVRWAKGEDVFVGCKLMVADAKDGT